MRGEGRLGGQLAARAVGPVRYGIAQVRGHPAIHRAVLRAPPRPAMVLHPVSRRLRRRFREQPPGDSIRRLSAGRLRPSAFGRRDQGA
ncbi:hypothetical protein GCM10023194_19170 [Planotetraspora phitsanulokensis]